MWNSGIYLDRTCLQDYVLDLGWKNDLKTENRKIVYITDGCVNCYTHLVKQFGIIFKRQCFLLPYESTIVFLESEKFTFAHVHKKIQNKDK